MSPSQFRSSLYKWNKTNHRPMPWKGEKDPYLIWLSEIILQQTRVARGWNYDLKFKAAFPKIQDLANAKEDFVLKLWQGLGYYTRARNLHASAKFINKKLNNRFPETYDEILKLKGVGPYTAAAIASFAFAEAKAVVDGNVKRVLARIFNLNVPIDTNEGKLIFQKKAGELLDVNNPGKFNQALMDFGSMVCTPKNAVCKSCTFNSNCRAHKLQLVRKLPVKSKKIKRTTRFFNYLFICKKDAVFVEKRIQNDIWKNLYQLPLIENRKLCETGELTDLIRRKVFDEDAAKVKLLSTSALQKQNLTHQKIVARFFEVEVLKSFRCRENYQEISIEKINTFAFPKIIDCYLRKKGLI